MLKPSNIDPNLKSDLHYSIFELQCLTLWRKSFHEISPKNSRIIHYFRNYNKEKMHSRRGRKKSQKLEVFAQNFATFKIISKNACDFSNFHF